jgi:hypothetical protein
MKWAFCLSLLAVPFTGEAQKLEIGSVEYFGLSSPGAPPKSQVDGCLAFKTGMLIDGASKNVWKDPSLACLKKLPGVKQATIDGVCCDEKNRLMMFVGLSYQAEPADTKGSFSADLQLPAAVIAAYDTLEGGMVRAIQTGQADEDDSKGHALFHFPKAAESQEVFATYASTNLQTLRDVLHTSRHDKDREVACWVIAFSTDKKGIVGDLVSAVTDPNEGVRNNAIRSLGTLDNYFRQTKVDMRIDPAPFVKLMNSSSWTDRNKSVNLLLSLTWDREPQLMSKLKKEALYPLADMARWKSTGHASAAFMILGRLAGWKDEVTNSRMNEDRGKWVDEMMRVIGKP